MDLVEKTIKGSAWAYGAEIIAKVISPLSFLVLTRILSPQDYGVVAVAITVLMFVNIISDLGTSQVLIQASDTDKKHFDRLCNSGFWINIVFGFALFIVVEIFAGDIAVYYKQPESKSVIQVMAIQIIFLSVSSVQNSLKKKDLNFKYLFYLRLITICMPIFIAIPIALLGGGYWALVISPVVGNALQAVVLWINSNWKPRFNFSAVNLRSLFSKSIWNTFSQVFIWIPISFDTYLIGKYMDSADLGLYTTSRSLFTSCSGLILAPIIPVVFSSMSKAKDKNEYLSIGYNSQKMLFSISVCLSLFVFIFADYINLILFNKNWDGITPIIRIVFLVMGFEYFGSIMYEAVRARGLFKSIAIVYFISLIFTVPLLYYSAQTSNIYNYTLTRSASLYIPMIGIFILSSKQGLCLIQCIKNNWIILCMSIIVIPAIFILRKAELSWLADLFIKMAIYIIFLIVFVVYNKKMVINFLRRIKSMISCKTTSKIKC